MRSHDDHMTRSAASKGRGGDGRAGSAEDKTAPVSADITTL